MGAIRWLLLVLALTGSAQAQTITAVIPHNEMNATTIPIPSTSCMFVDEFLGGSTYGNSKLCPANTAAWAAAFGFNSTVYSLVGTADIAAGAVTYPKIQNGGADGLLGTHFGASPSEVTMGANMQISGGVLTSKQDIQLTPGLSTAIGTCNTSIQHITGAGQINQQQCMRTVTAGTAGTPADSGFVVKMNCNGCTYTAVNPTGTAGNQGVYFDIVGDGNPSDTFIVATAGGTADFLGCPLGGGTTITAPGNGWIHIISNPDNNATNYYACAQYNGTTTVTVTNNYSGTAGTPIAVLTAAASSELDFITTNWSSAYHQMELRCTGLIVGTGGSDIYIRLHSGGSYQTASYDRAALYVDDSGAAPDSFTYSNASSSILFDAPTPDTTVMATLKMSIDNVSDTASYKPTRWSVSESLGGKAVDLRGSSIWKGGTGAIDGIQVIPSAGTFSGVCALLGVF